ncbi:MAG: hypothetical protein ACREAM_19085 [Blastocatellia bacterium]
MSEDNTGNPDADSTNPLPFEEFVRQHKVNVFIREQTHIKDDVRELREERLPKI